MSTSFTQIDSWPSHFESFFESDSFGRLSYNLSKGSLTIGDYQNSISHSPTSYLINDSYEFLSSTSSNYQDLQNLIVSWMSEDNDHDLQEWPGLKKELNDYRIQLSDEI